MLSKSSLLRICSQNACSASSKMVGLPLWLERGKLSASTPKILKSVLTEVQIDCLKAISPLPAFILAKIVGLASISASGTSSLSSYQTVISSILLFQVSSFISTIFLSPVKVRIRAFAPLNILTIM